MKLLLGKRKAKPITEIFEKLIRYNINLQQDLLKRLTLLPKKGCITTKIIKGQKYYYLVNGREGWKYYGKIFPKSLARKHHQRRRLQKQIRIINNNLYALGVLSRDKVDRMNPSKRFKILNRDAFTCQYCGRTIRDGIQLEIDHIVPKVKGGTDEDSNLLTACKECNEGKRGKLWKKKQIQK